MKLLLQNLFPDHRILHVNFGKAVITAANNVFGLEIVFLVFLPSLQSSFHEVRS